MECFADVEPLKIDPKFPTLFNGIALKFIFKTDEPIIVPESFSYGRYKGNAYASLTKWSIVCTINAQFSQCFYSYA